MITSRHRVPAGTRLRDVAGYAELSRVATRAGERVDDPPVPVAWTPDRRIGTVVAVVVGRYGQVAGRAPAAGVLAPHPPGVVLRAEDGRIRAAIAVVVPRHRQVR